VGEFYYELGIQLVEACLKLQEQTGGLVDMELLKKAIERRRGRNAIAITEYTFYSLLTLVRTLQEQLVHSSPWVQVML